MLMVQIASADSWWSDVKQNAKDITKNVRENLSSNVMLNHKLKHTKISANDMDAHVVHLRIALDETLNNGPVTVSIDGHRVKIKNEMHTRFVDLPSQVKSGQASYTLWYMEQEAHGPDKHYSKVQLPATLELRR